MSIACAGADAGALGLGCGTKHCSCVWLMSNLIFLIFLIISSDFDIFDNII